MKYGEMELLNICAMYDIYFNKKNIFPTTVTIGNADDTFAQGLLFSPFIYQVYMFILRYYIFSLLPVNTKNDNTHM